MQQSKISKDGKVIFNEESHTYIRLEDSKILKGVTGLISKYKNPFDKDPFAEKYCLKNGLIKEDVLEEWDMKGKVSRNQGHVIHKIFEDYINTGKIIKPCIYNNELQAERFIKNFFLTGRLIPVETEMIVYNDSIASQIDFIAKTPEGDHFIFDPKTNKEIEKNSYGKMMLAPFNHVPDASFYHYSIQVSIYKILCKEYDIKQCFIIHINDSGYDFIKPELINIPNHVINF
jgi:hypothetical protein